MAKRQTTGMPKKSRLNQANEVESQGLLDDLLGNPRTRPEREAAINKFVIRSTLGVVGLIVLLIALALSWEYLVVPTRTVATVNNDRITVGEFRDRLRFEQAYVSQQASARYAQLQQQAAQFGIDVNQFAQNDQQLQQWSRELQVADVLGQRVINDMVDELLIQQAAEERNITVDEETIDNQINDFFGYDPTQVALIGTDPTETPIPTETPTPFVSPTPTNTPLPTSTPEPTAIPETTPEVDAEGTEEAVVSEPEELATLPPSPTPSQEERLENFEEAVEIFRENLRDANGVNNAEIDALFEREALREALRQDLFGESDMTTYVNARHILVETEEEAQTIIEQLNNGAIFSEIARAQSIDTGSGNQGGELDWSPASNYVPEFRDATLNLAIGELSAPVESEFGYHIIQVRGREEREVTGNQLEQVRQAQFFEWLENYREENDDNININDNWPDFLS